MFLIKLTKDDASRWLIIGCHTPQRRGIRIRRLGQDIVEERHIECCDSPKSPYERRNSFEIRQELANNGTTRLCQFGRFYVESGRRFPAVPQALHGRPHGSMVPRPRRPSRCAHVRDVRFLQIERVKDTSFTDHDTFHIQPDGPRERLQPRANQPLRRRHLPRRLHAVHARVRLPTPRKGLLLLDAELPRRARGRNAPLSILPFRSGNPGFARRRHGARRTLRAVHDGSAGRRLRRLAVAARGEPVGGPKDRRRREVPAGHRGRGPHHRRGRSVVLAHHRRRARAC